MNRAKEIVLSSLGHTWILDLDGTLVKHNGYKIDGADSLLTEPEVLLTVFQQKIILLFLHQEKKNTVI